MFWSEYVLIRKNVIGTDPILSENLVRLNSHIVWGSGRILQRSSSSGSELCTSCRLSVCVTAAGQHINNTTSSRLQQVVRSLNSRFLQEKFFLVISSPIWRSVVMPVQTVAVIQQSAGYRDLFTCSTTRHSMCVSMSSAGRLWKLPQLLRLSLCKTP